MVHDDAIKWEHLRRYWPLVRGIHRSPVNSPHNGQWRGALVFSLICVWINGVIIARLVTWDAIAPIITSLQWCRIAWFVLFVALLQKLLMWSLEMGITGKWSQSMGPYPDHRLLYIMDSRWDGSERWVTSRERQGISIYGSFDCLFKSLFRLIANWWPNSH